MKKYGPTEIRNYDKTIRALDFRTPIGYVPAPFCGSVGRVQMDSLSGLRVAIYARHSTHMQTGSAEDQIARCVTLVEQQDGLVAGIYRDEARTDATAVQRKGINRLVSDAGAERFDAVLFEDLSRLSRDIADTATVFRVLTFAGIALHSVTEGRITELHIGLKGTMNALYLRDLGDKSKRGLLASVKRGRIISYPYGYERNPTFDETGKQIPGQVRINEAQAAVVRRIYEEFAAGKPAAEIVRDLNREGIPSARGGQWSKVSLYGARARRDGLLRRPLYIGEYIWGRHAYPTDPATGKKSRQPLARTEWAVAEVPHLAIVERELWEKVQERLTQRPPRPDPKNRLARRPSQPKGPQHHVTSGITWCARCGGRLTTVRGGWLRCHRRDSHMICDQAYQIPRHSIVCRVLRVLRMRLVTQRHHLLEPIRQEHEKRHRAAVATTARRDALEAAVAHRRQKLAALLDIVEDGTGGDETRARIRSHEKRLRADRRSLEDLAVTASRMAEQNLAVVEGRARTRLLAAIDHLLAVDGNDAEAIEAVRTALARIETAYRGPGRARLRADPHLDPAGVYDLGLRRRDDHETGAAAEAA